MGLGFCKTHGIVPPHTGMIINHLGCGLKISTRFFPGFALSGLLLSFGIWLPTWPTSLMYLLSLLKILNINCHSVANFVKPNRSYPFSIIVCLNELALATAYSLISKLAPTTAFLIIFSPTPPSYNPWGVYPVSCRRPFV